MVRLRTSRGFTLLEAIVALSIFATSTVALYSWYNVVLTGMVRTEAQLETIEFSRNLEAYLSMMQLQDEATGEFRSNGLLAIWRAELVEEKKEGRTLVGALGHYRFGLYTVNATIVEERTRQEKGHLQTRLVGYEGVRLPRQALTDER